MDTETRVDRRWGWPMWDLQNVKNSLEHVELLVKRVTGVCIMLWVVVEVFAEERDVESRFATTLLFGSNSMYKETNDSFQKRESITVSEFRQSEKFASRS